MEAVTEKKGVEGRDFENAEKVFFPANIPVEEVLEGDEELREEFAIVIIVGTQGLEDKALFTNARDE